MVQQNLNKYPIECPICQGIDFQRSIRLEYGQSMIEKHGPLFCMGCHNALPLDRAIKAVQMRMKLEDLEQMQQEIEQMGA